MKPSSSSGSPVSSSSTDVEHVERPRADLVHVGAQLVAAQDRQLVAGLARVLDRVVEAPQLAVHRLAAADPLHQPQLLEVGDVAEVPGERAEDRRVDGVELLVGERLDQEEGPLARLREAVGDLLAQVGLGRRRDVEKATQAAISANVNEWIWSAPMQTEGASALVAGGASGLGEATARRLHADGAGVVIADLNAEQGPGAGRRARRRGRASSRRTCSRPSRSRRRSTPPTGRGRAADLGLLRGDRLGAADGLQAGPARPRDLLQRDQGQPDRHLQRAAARGDRDGRQRARRAAASAASASTPPRSPPSTARSARSPTRPRRAGSSASRCRRPATSPAAACAW